MHLSSEHEPCKMTYDETMRYGLESSISLFGTSSSTPNLLLNGYKTSSTMATETTETITRHLKSREQGRYIVNLLDFIKIEDVLHQSKSRCVLIPLLPANLTLPAKLVKIISWSDRFTYDARAGTFRFISPTLIHAGGYHWFYGWVRDMECRRMIGTEYIDILGNVDLRGFEGEFTGR